MEIRRDLLPNVFTGILVLCAVIVTGLTVHQYLSNHQKLSPSAKHINAWKYLINNRPVNIGKNNAKVKIVEFSDYQCPYCRELDPNLQELVKQSQGSVAIVRYDYPLTVIHEYAYKAAIASKCAAAQGIYGPYETDLFKANLATADWVGLARKENVPYIQEFAKCVGTNQTAPLVKKDIDIASQIGIKATPTLVINGNVIPGMETTEALNRLISESK